MELTVEKTVQWEAAHLLPMMPVGHKCRNVHGHTYTLTVGVLGEVDRNGIVWDFGDLKDLMNKRVVRYCDHKDLNAQAREDVVGMPPNPTGENLVAWIVARLRGQLPNGVTLASIELREGNNNATRWTA